jgi:hypothetical protein
MSKPIVAGISYPTVTTTTGNPRDSAALHSQNTSTKLAGLNGVVKGGKKKYRGGAITVPVVTPSYPGGSDTTKIMTLNAQIGTQGAADRAFDANATIKGGKRPKTKKRQRTTSKRKRTNSKRKRKRKTKRQ